MIVVEGPTTILSHNKSSHFKDGIIDLLAGTAGGISNVYAGQPLDTVKVKMQTFPKLYANWIVCLKETFKTDGIRGLYAGTSPALVANIAENAVLFAAYGACCKSLAVLMGKEKDANLTPLESAFSGSLAAIFAAGVLCPTELVKCKLQAQKETHPNIHHSPFLICRDMYKSGGIRSFFNGMTPTLLREVPGYFFFFGAYETCRYLLTPENKTKEDIGLLRTAISGAAGGAALWTAIFPADVIKSRMQVSGTGQPIEIFMSILKNEGAKALYKGLTPTLIRTCTASSSLFIAYEQTRIILNSAF